MEQALYDQGLYLQAYEMAVGHFGPLASWQGTEARVFAGRLAANLGGDRLNRKLLISAWRADRSHPLARVYALRSIAAVLGVDRQIELMRQWGEMQEASAEVRQLYCCHWSDLWSQLRDFAQADAWLKKAESISGPDPWIHFVRSQSLEKKDCYEEALAEVRRGLELKPWFRPAVQQAGHLLQILNRDDEALELLSESMRHLESGSVALQRAMLLSELNRHEELEPVLAEYVRVSPLLEKEQAKNLSRFRFQACYFRGDFAGAAVHLRGLEDDYARELAQRLEDPACRPQRVELPVGFVRQHWKTCSPATFVALARYWGREVDHLKLAADICYDGTPSWKERQWAEAHGWTVREFRLDWESARQLLDRGIPFAVSTGSTTGGHRQAVIGYDAVRRTLIIRDPYYYYSRDALAEAFLKQQAFLGPESMLILPPEEASRLEGLELPDAALYDLFYQLRCSLGANDRAAAHEAAARLATAAPDHLLALFGRQQMAGYDGNFREALACAERLLEKYPEAGRYRILRLEMLESNSRRDDRLRMLRDICEGADSEPVFWQKYAEELSSDARFLEEAWTWVRKSLLFAPEDPESWKCAANLLWARQDWRKAREYYWIAACMDINNEEMASRYFAACRHLKATPVALKFLQRRFQESGRKSSGPAITLFDKLALVDRDVEAFQVLGRALEMRPEDGSLRLFAVDRCLRYGRKEEAVAHLEAARGRTRPLEWLKKAAYLDEFLGEPEKALERWREVHAIDPLQMPVVASLARLLAETRGLAAAQSFLEEQGRLFPCQCELQRIRIQWLWYDGPQAVEPVVRQILADDPADAWAWRELGFVLVEQERPAEARETAARSLEMEPHAAAGHCLLGEALERLGLVDEAREAFRRAIVLSADYSRTFSRLLQTCRTVDEKRTELAFIAAELERQTLFGDGLLEFRILARTVLEPEALLERLRAALAARPDLWHAWVAVSSQLLFMQRQDEAAAVARQGLERFPLLPSLHLQLGRILRLSSHPAEAIQALEQALQLSPDYEQASMELATLHEESDDGLERARIVLQAGLHANPLSAALHSDLAWNLWLRQCREEALQRLQRALALDPDCDSAWSRLQVWAAELEKPGLAADIARDLVKRRGGEAKIWLRLAGILQDLPGAEAECEAAIARAITLRPRLVEAHVLKVDALAGWERFDEATAACRPEAYGGQIPVELRVLEGRLVARQGSKGALEQGVELIRQALSSNPDYHAGWKWLAQMSNELEQKHHALDAAREMVRLAPFDLVSRGYLGFMAEKAGNVELAFQEFRQALEMEPTYRFAAEHLASLLEEQKQPEEAARLLDAMAGRGVFSEGLAAVRIRLALARGQREEAFAGLKEMCRSPLESSEPLKTAVEQVCGGSALKRPPSRKEVARFLETVAAEPEASPWVGEELARLWRQRGWWFLHFKLRKFVPGSPAGAQALLAAMEDYLDDLEKFEKLQNRPITLGSFRLRFWLFLWCHGEWLRTDTLAWANFGRVLMARNELRRGRKWFHNWRDREGVEPWMMIDWLFLLLNNNRWDPAYRLARMVVAFLKPDHAMPYFRMIKAFYEVQHGDPRLAEEQLQLIDIKSFSEDFWLGVHDGCRLLLELDGLAAAEADPGRRRTQLWERVAAWQQDFNARRNRGTIISPVSRVFQQTLKTAVRRHSFGFFKELKLYLVIHETAVTAAGALLATVLFTWLMYAIKY